jgi:hypothetical protein
VSVEFLGIGDKAVLTQVTVTSPEIEDCDNMASAFSSLVGLVQAKYAKGAKIRKGSKYGDRACKHYMKKGNVFFDANTKQWMIDVDSYWSSGGYYVYLSYSYLPHRAQLHARKAAARSEKIVDSLEKL